MKLKFYILLTAILILLPACGGSAATSETQAVPASPTATDPATAIPEETQPQTEASATNTLSPTAAITAESSMLDEDEEMSPIESTNWLEVEGKTEDGYTYLGNPDAPVTMTDYSDFL